MGFESVMPTDFMANKNFTGSPIVPEAYGDLPPEQQYNERTTKPAIWLGKKLKDSPMRLDYIINNNLGVLAEYLQGRQVIFLCRVMCCVHVYAHFGGYQLP